VKRYLGTLATALCAAGLFFVVFTIIAPALFGLQRYVITGGSMTGAISKGAVIYSKITPVDQLRVGDIITFHPPGGSVAVTHRIIAIESGSNGGVAFKTKGDFNEEPDPWNPITLNEPQQARYVFQIPLYGYLLAGLTMRNVRLLLIGAPAFIIALSMLWSLWAKAGEEAATQVDPRAAALPDVPHDARSRA
jgi:signal peptidase I